MKPYAAQAAKLALRAAVQPAGDGRRDGGATLAAYQPLAGCATIQCC